MTAEVAVMNKSAVALAADSAVTITTGESNQSKVFNTANKLFTLSKTQPVGIMVYNTMELGGVPWETIIKEYRRNLGVNSLETIKEYCDSFFEFLCDNETLFPSKLQNAVVHKMIHRRYKVIKDHLEKAANLDSDFSASEYLIQLVEEAESADFSEDFDGVFEARVVEKYEQDFRVLASLYFDDFEDDHLNSLVRLSTLVLTRNVDHSGFTGIVITGFGEKEIFPHLFEYKVDAIVLGKVKRALKQEVEINCTSEAYVPSKVLPFAQHSSIKTILEGIHPKFNEELYDSFIKLVLSLPKELLDSITELDEEQKATYQGAAFEASLKAFEEFSKKIHELRTNEYTAPIENAISMMPIGELATVAEVFVNLEQIQQRMSLDTETVGGPIDVAVISKHDGFVWIKRKHYFDLKLNPGFVTTYFDGIERDNSLLNEADHD